MFHIAAHQPPQSTVVVTLDNLRLVALCNSGLRQVVLDFFVLINEHRIYGCEEHACLPFMTFFPPGINPDWMIGGVSHGSFQRDRYARRSRSVTTRCLAM